MFLKWLFQVLLIWRNWLSLQTIKTTSLSKIQYICLIDKCYWYGFQNAWLCTYYRYFLARLYESTGRSIANTTASASASVSASALALLKMLNVLGFLVKVFKSLYLLNPWMDLVGTLSDVRYWSEVLCCTITTHIDHPEVKVTDFEILS